jgi:aspartate/methionine/tyrosine aminotransferase
VDAAANRITSELRHLRESGRRILDLTQSNPTETGLAYPREQILDSLTKTQILTYEPSPNGILPAREAVSDYLGSKVAASRIFLTASTSEAYSYLFKLLCNPGETVLAPRPSYPLIDVLAKLESIDVKQYALHYDYGWHIDFDSLQAAIRGSAARAVLVVNPNNPTGSFLSRADWAALVEVCKTNQLALICDEVFNDYGFQPDPARVRSVAGNDDVLTFSLSGLSKICALPQMKLAWIAASGPSILIDEAMERLEWIADSFLSPGAPVQWATPQLLDLRFSIQQQIHDRTKRNLQALRQQAKNSPANVLPVDGGWYATLQVPRLRSEEDWVLELLRRHGVLVQPGYFFDFTNEAYLVLSLLTDAGLFDEGLSGLFSLVNEA